jgi:hypothetical protein
LVDERVGHRMVSFGLCPRRGGVLHGVLIDSENLERIPRRSSSYLGPASYAVQGETAKLGPSFWISHLTPRDTGRAGSRRGVERRPSP